VKGIYKAAGIVLALAALGGVMAYLSGFFNPKIDIDFAGVVPSEDEGRVVTVEITKQPLFEEAAGTIKAKVETVISPLITATISSIKVRAGDNVKQGDVLVELDSRELKARADQAHQSVIAAKAKLAKAERDFNRMQQLFETEAVAKAELDRTEALLRTARAELSRARRREDEAKTALGHSTLAAPISGRVVERYAEPGDTARQGNPLLRIYGPGIFRLEASVRESVASKLVKGQSLNVKVDALDKEFEASVDEIVPFADPGSRSFIVKARLTDSSGLYPGMFGRLLVPIGETKKIYIPADAVTHIGQLDFVIVQTDQGPIRRYVRLGATDKQDRVEVISGLAPGEAILTSAQ
jgi:membrane fusion protein (multidrug efflux system)